MKITKSIEINENILTLYNFISIMYYNDGNDFPDEIISSIEDLLSKLTKHLEKDFLDLDIIDDKLIRKVTFTSKK